MKPTYKLGKLHYPNFSLRIKFHFVETLERENTISGLMEETVKLCVTDMIKIYQEFKSLCNKNLVTDPNMIVNLKVITMMIISYTAKSRALLSNGNSMTCSTSINPLTSLR